MPKGLLAEWRRRMVSRGLAAALLLAVPVGVAAAIGFEGSIGGLGEGLDALVSGPEGSQVSAASSEGDEDAIDSAISALATPTGAGLPGAGGPGAGGPGGGGDDDGGAPAPGGSPGGGSPGGGSPGGGSPGGGGGGGGAPAIDPSDVELPNSNPVGDLVDELQDGVGGLLPGG